MNVEAIQKEIEQCSPEEQDQIAACLSVLRLRRTRAHGERLSDRLKDTSPQNWLTIENLKEKLKSGE